MDFHYGLNLPTKEPESELHLLEGIGGGILGGILAGNVPVCAVEIEEYRREILLQRQRDGILPRFPIWDDVKTFNGMEWRGKIDIISGGFPCQDISIAGKGQGITGNRSGLWKDMARIVNEIRPKYVFIENSPEILRRGVETVFEDLAKMGYDAVWGILGARHLGASHKRDRFWCLAYPMQIRVQGFRDHQKNTIEVQTFWKSIENANSFWNGGNPTKSNSLHQRTISGVDDGIPHGVDRIKAIGDAQVPQVACLAFTWLKSLIKEGEEL